MTTTYFTITSIIDKKVNTEDFLLGDDVLDVMDQLDKVAIRNFGADHFPLEDGNIGYYSQQGVVLLEEHDLLAEKHI
jgi:hypothetical protein